jgi:hypothetical protein
MRAILNASSTYRSGRYEDDLPARLPYVLADFFPLPSLESGRLRSENL